MAQKKTDIRILIVEDHVYVAEGLKCLLEAEAGFVITTAKDKNEAVQHCRDSLKLDLILMDVELPNGENGLNLTQFIKQEFKEKYPQLKVMISTAYGESGYKQRAREVGAVGFIAKGGGNSSKELLQAIRSVHQGEEYWPKDQKQDVPISKSPTPTELKILKYLARGKTTAQIGIELAMLETTVSVHRRNIKQRYNLTSRGDLVLFACKCMDLYGIPPDPVFYAALEKQGAKFKTDTNVDVKVDGETEGFDNSITCTLLRVIEETLSDIRHRDSAKNVFIQLKRNAIGITLIIREEVKSGRKGVLKRILKVISPKEEKEALRQVLNAIGGELEMRISPNNGTTVIANISIKQPMNIG